MALEETDVHQVELEKVFEANDGEDKIFAAMGVAKTVATVSGHTFIMSRLLYNLCAGRCVRRRIA